MNERLEMPLTCLAQQCQHHLVCSLIFSWIQSCSSSYRCGCWKERWRRCLIDGEAGRHMKKIADSDSVLPSLSEGLPSIPPFVLKSSIFRERHCYREERLHRSPSTGRTEHALIPSPTVDQIRRRRANEQGII